MAEHEQHDDHSQEESTREEDRSGPASKAQSDQAAISTADPAVAAGPKSVAEWRKHPDATQYSDTSHVASPMSAPLFLDPENPAERGDGNTPKGDNEKHSSRDQQSVHKNPKGRTGERGQENGKEHSQGDRDKDERESRHPEPNPQPSPWRNILISAGVALAAGMIGAAAILYFFGPSKSEGNSSHPNEKSDSQKKGSSSQKGQKDQNKDKGVGSDETSQSGSSIPGFTLAQDADSLRRQVEHLSERIDHLGHRLDTTTRTRDETPPDVRTLQIKMADLTRTMEEVGNLPARFRRLENRFEDLQQDLKSLRDRLSSSLNEEPLADSARKADRAIDETRQEPLAISPPSTVSGRPDTTLAQGIALFKDGHYAESTNLFRKLQVTRPDDARVWYYAALSTGLKTGDWTGAARELVERGLNCEQAGMPEKDEIDASLTGLTEAQGRKWLSAYRSKNKPNR